MYYPILLVSILATFLHYALIMLRFGSLLLSSIQGPQDPLEGSCFHVLGLREMSGWVWDSLCHQIACKLL